MANRCSIFLLMLISLLPIVIHILPRKPNRPTHFSITRRLGSQVFPPSSILFKIVVLSSISSSPTIQISLSKDTASICMTPSFCFLPPRNGLEDRWIWRLF